jgi:uncharacterized protein (TIGR03067 family)
MRCFLTVCAVVVLLQGAGCSKSRLGESVAAAAPGPTDLERLQGNWRIKSSIWNGTEEPPIARSVTIMFQGDKFIIVDKDGQRMQETIRLMPDQSPKAIDCTSKDSGVPTPGIYSLDGDTMQWCSAGGAKRVRPKAFASQPGSKHSLMVLVRVKN